MTIRGAVLLYHNGNGRVIEKFKKKFRFNDFKGNWADQSDQARDHALYEISIADATDANLFKARDLGIRIYRYVSSYADDKANSVPEFVQPSHDDWLKNVVCKNLCFADVIDNAAGLLDIDHTPDDRWAIITTGRTANTHLQKANPDIDMFECPKILDANLIKAKQAIFLWRQDQWQCLTSHWIMANSQPIHQYNGLITATPKPTSDLPRSWIESDWKNICQIVLDQALFFRYVLNRTVNHMTTEDAIKRFHSSSEKIHYDKSTLIPNYQEMQDYYGNSSIEKLINMCYHNTLIHLV